MKLRNSSRDNKVDISVSQYSKFAPRSVTLASAVNTKRASQRTRKVKSLLGDLHTTLGITRKAPASKIPVRLMSHDGTEPHPPLLGAGADHDGGLGEQSAGHHGKRADGPKDDTQASRPAPAQLSPGGQADDPGHAEGPAEAQIPAGTSGSTTPLRPRSPVDHRPKLGDSPYQGLSAPPSSASSPPLYTTAPRNEGVDTRQTSRAAAAHTSTGSAYVLPQATFPAASTSEADTEIVLVPETGQRAVFAARQWAWERSRPEI